jgi:hypothetical protein
MPVLSAHRIRLTVIIPLGPGEQSLGRLGGDLLLLPDDAEIIFVCCPESRDFPERSRLNRLLGRYRVIWHEAPTGRGTQLNAGARMAGSDRFWFLHADSGFDSFALTQMLIRLPQQPDALCFFKLRFLSDGAGWMLLNQWGAHLRSSLLGVPFGDQGFCCSKQLFEAVDGFPESSPYGEDHLFVWRIRRAGFKLYSLGLPLWTSARKYRHHGWFALTLKYQFLWIKQAVPQWWAWVRGE